MRSLFAILVIAFAITVSVLSANINAQDSTAHFSMEVNGHTLTAENRQDYITMDGLIKTIQALDRLQKEGELTVEDYEAKVAILLEIPKK